MDLAQFDQILLHPQIKNIPDDYVENVRVFIRTFKNMLEEMDGFHHFSNAELFEKSIKLIEFSIKIEPLFSELRKELEKWIKFECFQYFFMSEYYKKELKF